MNIAIAPNGKRETLRNLKIWKRKDKIKFISTYIESVSSKILEIGPNLAPVISKSQYINAEYLETVDTSGLNDRALKKGINIDYEIDHVLNFDKGFVNSLPKDFLYNYLVSSHVIEHIPNFVKHLIDIESLLEENGCYLIVIPDRNLMFDFLRPETTLGEVVQRYILDSNEPTISSVIDSIFYSVQDEELKKGWWNSDFGGDLDFLVKNPGLRTKHLIETKQTSFPKWSGHSTVFSPISFSRLIFGLRQIGLLNLSLVDIQPTGHMDFIAVLSKDKTKANLKPLQVKKLLIQQGYFNSQKNSILR